jgi:hypothetical protein
VLIPLTDSENPLTKEMLKLIGAHSHRNATVDAQSVGAHSVDGQVEALRTHRGRTLVTRVLAPRNPAPALTPVI